MDDGELLVVIGPPAVGKMTVGRAVCSRSDFRLFHNHHTIEPLAEVVRQYVAPYADRGSPVSFVELYTGLETRLVRNVQPDRVAAKPSKADLAWSDAHVRESDELQRLNTDPEHPSLADEVIGAHRHLRLDNTHLTPGEAAEQILPWLASRQRLHARGVSTSVAAQPARPPGR